MAVPKIALRIRFRGSGARNSAERKINVMQTEPPDPGGSLDASVTLTSTKKIKGDILSFGTAADVIAPESLRTKVAQELQQGTTHYTTDSPSSNKKAGSTKQ
ncbi:WYL domain-containing protein [Rosistilla carotiformis]|uniref:WYL domain-containing protein n=1 Tax=Rosistilla carotiformis TaxID=2528017 RepID=UPI001E4D30AD|nr:WYL domain-containing protein [Rosistilla carotiformis]